MKIPSKDWIAIPRTCAKDKDTEIAALKAKVEPLDYALTAVCRAAKEAMDTVERLSAPVSRHNETDGILQRYFITGGRQYRYTRQDAVDLESLINEWIAARKEKP